MDTIRFDRHPATVTIGDGIGIATRYLMATWEWWLIPVVGLAMVSGLLSGVAANAALASDFRDLPTSEQVSQLTGLILPVFGVTILLTIASVVVGWFYSALAIHGLRSRPITADWVLGAGVRSFAGSVLLAVAWIGAWIVFAIVAVITHGILLVALIGLIPAAMYIAIRIFFWTLAIFDGAGITESFRVSWRLSDGAVLRMLGWGIAFVLLSVVASLASRVLVIPFSGMPAIAAFVDQLVAGTISVFTLFGTAVLYESQRWTTMPPAYGVPSHASPGPTPPWALPGAAAPGGYPPYAPTASTDPFAPPPAPSTYGQAPSYGQPASTAGAPGTPPPLVPWAPVPPAPTWTPTPAPGWVSAPPTTIPPAPAAHQPPPVDPFARAPGATPSPDAAALAPADDAPTEPYTPPPA